MRKTMTLLCLFIGICWASAQTKITGTVVSADDGQPVIGATVVAKGTSVGTVTNVDGAFSINVPSGAKTLVFSYVGMVATEAAPQNGMKIILKSDTKQMKEVVVTALGIKRDKKTLTYASQQVGGDELKKASDMNFMDALSGKAAGIDIKTSSSGAGGSTKAVLRGNKSISGLSEPLYVIDGIPMVNNKHDQPGSYGGTDTGDGLSQINPDDIESINILKGANASILYGSQGANGVVLITTKKGKADKVSVSFSSSTIFENVSQLPKLQYTYGAVNGSDYSWSTTKSDSYQKDYVKNFFQTGVNTINSVSVTGGNAKTQVYFSYANTYAKGTMPTNSYVKNNFTFNSSTKLLNDKLTLSSGVIFAQEKTKNRPGAGYYDNPLTGLYLFPRERDFNYYKTNYAKFNSDRNLNVMNWFSSEEKENNPYWILNEDSKLDQTKRVIANMKASYEINKHLKLEVRGNIDYADKLQDYRLAAGGNSVSVKPTGSWTYANYNDQALYTDGIVSYNNTFGKLSVTALAGLAYQNNTFSNGISANSNAGDGLIFPNFFALQNLPAAAIVQNTIDRSIKEGAFANVQLGYKDMLYLDLSGRNDWASTLSLTPNDSYFYPAVGLTGIISQMVKLPEAISFAKVRASWSNTANDVPFNKIEKWYTVANKTGGTTAPTYAPFNNAKPEMITSNEVGAEMRFLSGRIGMEATYYYDVSKNQFVQVSAPSGSGYDYQFLNVGKLVNKGFELTLDAEPIKSRTFGWKTSVNYSMNTNKIEELIASDPNYAIGSNDEGFKTILKAGGSFNDLYVYHFARNSAGQIILDANGKPTAEGTQTYAGNVNSKWNLGWNNSVSYKDFFLSMLVTGKFGGVCISKTQAFLDSYGVSKTTGDARDLGYVAVNAIQGTTAVNQVDPVKYYSVVGDRNGIMEPYVYSRTNVRLSQLSIGYNINVKKLHLPLQDASVSLVGRDLFFFYKKAPYDPESAMSTSNSMQSNEVFSMPASRYYGINLKVNF
ncbi:SusC/RagA family TonB-linked outer membrane protein [Paludibacter sp.]|uniref:SusC/RagA family TonB-linked outer membrane protein n=1 Tax=Paludibacter sp. TaxID=1898105 RepID=UPI001355DE54|nr:SusC/RagA family TonB-linked outer membrane protein [Paludibacter sp.]MTK54624.1 SusC/RagA family TonB-linked outer membrane protein [Paludibacter sp.]